MLYKTLFFIKTILGFRIEKERRTLILRHRRKKNRATETRLQLYSYIRIMRRDLRIRKILNLIGCFNGMFLFHFLKMAAGWTTPKTSLLCTPQGEAEAAIILRLEAAAWRNSTAADVTTHPFSAGGRRTSGNQTGISLYRLSFYRG